MEPMESRCSCNKPAQNPPTKIGVSDLIIALPTGQRLSLTKDEAFELYKSLKDLFDPPCTGVVFRDPPVVPVPYIVPVEPWPCRYPMSPTWTSTTASTYKATAP